MTINFYINNDNRYKKVKPRTIFCYIRVFQQYIILNTHETVFIKDWNPSTQQVRRSCLEFAEINAQLDKFKRLIKEVLRPLMLNNELTFDDYKIALLKRFSNKSHSNLSFFEVYDNFLEAHKLEVTQSTIKKYLTLKALLLSYQEYSQQPLTLNSINIQFEDSFKKYSIEVRKHQNNNIAKNFELFTSFLNWAVKRGFTTNQYFIKFNKPKLNKVENITLTMDEFLKLINLDLSDKPVLDRVRDVYVFTSLVGQRWSDVCSLEKKDIRKNVWHLTSLKTREPLQIPLPDIALTILTKYSENEKPLPVISLQKTNEYLKEVCRIAGFDDIITLVTYSGSERIDTTKPKYQLITFHSSRRLFSTLSLELGLRPEVVKLYTGHDSKVFENSYVKPSNQATNKELLKAWNSLPVPSNN